jgi:3-methyladenine DNA glycosylase AlkD
VVEQDSIAKLYLKKTRYINNWDLVDLSAYTIIGPYSSRHKDLLPSLARSKSIWERRIAMVATYYYIARSESEVPFQIAQILLYDSHDLIQKAVGWMLRETGNKCGQEKLENFLLQNDYTGFPRTTLRYAIERFPEQRRQEFLQGNA